MVILLHTEFGSLPTLFHISWMSFGWMSTNDIQGTVLVPLLITLVGVLEALLLEFRIELWPTPWHVGRER